MDVRKAVICIIFNEDQKFLVIKRQYLWVGWEFPKGGLEEGEDEETALKREVEEETGLDNIEIKYKLPYKIEYDYPEDYKKMFGKDRTEQSIFLAKTKDKKIKLSFEHSDFKWLSYEEARAALKHENQKKALDAAWEWIKRHSSTG